MKLNRRKTVHGNALLGLFILFTALPALSQDIPVSGTYPQNDFRPPLDLNPSLAGSFGEIRANHFHSGFDFRTNQREGYPVYAVADGYVSRLRVQIGGFGNAVYITHPNGYTTVYGHLQRFNTRLARVVKDYQYRKKSFSVDFPLMPIEIPVKKGEIIAWSGNTGNTGGPHLHFEIRDSKTEETINPQLFGVDVPDRVKPTITGLYMYRLNGKPFSENTPRQYFRLAGSGGNYSLSQSPVIRFSGDIGFGITTYDIQPAGNKNGVYSIELKMDGTTVYLSALERFAFSNSRAVNAHIDYPYRLLYGGTIQKCFVEPGDPLRIYKTVVNRGIINVKDDSTHNMILTVKDVKGNTSTLNFRIKYNPSAVIETKEKPGVKKFFYNQQNEYITSDVKISIPPGILYGDINLEYSKDSRPRGGYSAIHKIHTRLIPVHSNYDLWIKADSTMPVQLRDKALIVDTRGISQGGSYDSGYVKARPSAFGSFYITTDTTPPSIRPLNISSGKSMKGTDRITLKISDNLSGIQSFNGYIDGQWVLMEFEPKTSTLWYTFDDTVSPGKHHFQLVVTDMKMNSKTYNAIFYK